MRLVLIIACTVLLVSGSQPGNPALLDRGRTFLENQEIDSALAYFTRALQSATHANDQHGQAITFNEMAASFRQRADRDSVRVYATRALDLGLQLWGEEHEEVAESYDWLGYCFQTSNLDSALHYHNKALSIRQKVLEPTAEPIAESLASIGDVLGRQGNLDQELEHYLRALEIIKAGVGAETNEAARMMSNIGWCYGQQGDFVTQYDYHYKSLMIRQEILDLNHPDVAISLNNVGANCLRRGDNRGAVDFLRRAADIIEDIPPEDIPELAGVWYNLATAYGALGDRDNELVYLKRTLESDRNSFGESHFYVALDEQNLGLCQMHLGNYEAALEHLHRAVAIAEDALPGAHQYKGNIYRALVRVHSERGDLDQAKHWFERSRTQYLQVYGEENPIAAEVYDLLATAYATNADTIAALTTLGHALELARGGLERPDYLLGNICFKLSGLYDRPQERDSALFWVQQAIIGVCEVFDNEDPMHNPVASDIFVSPEVTEILLRKMQLLIAANETDVALATGLLADSIITEMLSFHRQDGSRERLVAAAQQLYRTLVRLCATEFQRSEDPQLAHQALQFIEKGGNVNLRTALAEASARNLGRIPDSILANDQRLKVDIAFHREALRNANKAKDTAAADASLRLLQQSELERQELLRKIESEYANWFAVRYQESLPSLQELQHSLERQTQMLIYQLDGESVTCIAVDRRSIEIRDDLEVDTAQCRELITQLSTGLSHNTRTSDSTFAAASFGIYESIVEPVQRSEHDHLIIIPDGILAYLPFEVLTTELANTSAVDFGALPYLLRDYNISYSWSPFSAFHFDHERAKAPESFAAWAPRASSAGLAQLKGNDIEAIECASVWSGDVWSEEATEQQFTASAREYQILHLATHAITDDQEPLASFLDLLPSGTERFDGALTAAEVYNLELNADLVVLSACNTGDGEFASGEGVKSLGRAFAFAGSPSTVTSLWSLPDLSTSSLMTDFYKHLKSGETIATSLREAKLSYLANIDDPLRAHPFFWAALVAQGDGEIAKASTRPLWIWLVGGAALLIALLVVRKLV